MHAFTPIVIVRVTRYGTQPGAFNLREIDPSDKRDERLHILPMAECVEMPHLLMPPIRCADGQYRPFGSILFPWVEAALRKRGAFHAPQAEHEKSPNGFSYRIVSPL